MEYSQEEISSFVIGILKRSLSQDGISEYHQLIISLMSDEASGEDLIALYRDLISGENVHSLLREINFASRFNKAELEFLEELQSLFLKENFMTGIKSLLHYYNYLRRTERYFKGVTAAFVSRRKGKVYKPEDLKRFCLLSYELEQLSSDSTINPFGLREAILQSLETGVPVMLVHMKCLRYVYPQGRLRIGEDMEYLKIQTKTGQVHIPRQEKDLFKKLKGIADTFIYYGIPVQLNIIIADYELDAFGKVVAKEDIFINRDRLQKYFVSLGKELNEVGLNASLLLASDLLDDTFYDLKNSIGNNLARGLGVGKLSPNAFEVIVNRAYTRYSELLAKMPSRQVAREFSIDLVSGVLALQYLFRVLFDGKAVLIEDSRGNENYYIGTGMDGKQPFSIIFTNLRD